LSIPFFPDWGKRIGLSTRNHTAAFLMGRLKMFEKV
jgi:hypothetical protein